MKNTIAYTQEAYINSETDIVNELLSLIENDIITSDDEDDDSYSDFENGVTLSINLVRIGVNDFSNENTTIVKDILTSFFPTLGTVDYVNIRFKKV